MKQLLIIILLITNLFPLLGQTPNADEMLRQKRTQIRYLLQQIVALKAYGKVLKKGYDIAQKGLNTISDIKNGSFSRDKDYINALKQVKPAISNSAKGKEVLWACNEITTGLQALSMECQHHEHFTHHEIKYIEAVCQNMLHEMGAARAELSIVLTSGETEMQDAERILRLDQLHQDILNMYAFTQHFIAGTRQLAIQRAKEKNQINIARQLSTKP